MYFLFEATMDDLKTDLLKLQELDEALKQSKALSSVNNDEWNAFLQQAVEVVLLKNKLNTEFVKSSTLILDDENAIGLLTKINSGKLLFADLIIRSFEEVTGKQLELNKLDWQELNALASDHLYSWFGPTEYIERLIEIGSLVLNISIPKELDSIVNQARQCYAFEQYIAVYLLCRTILESAMRDICLRIGKIEKIEDTKIFYEKYRPKDLIKFVSNCDSELKGRVEKLYHERLSAIVHGLKLSDSDGAQYAFRETIMMVQELYQKNQSRFL